MKRTRRQALKLLAAGTAAVLATPAASLAATTRTRPRAGARGAKTSAAVGPGPAAVQAEVEKQKRDLAKMLKILRDHPLPAGSEQGFAFAPLRPVRARSGR